MNEENVMLFSVIVTGLFGLFVIAGLIDKYVEVRQRTNKEDAS